jgi:hypothetical protein
MNLLKTHQMALLIMAGALVALIAPVNSLIAGFLSPLLSSITGGKGSYV